MRDYIDGRNTKDGGENQHELGASEEEADNPLKELFGSSTKADLIFAFLTNPDTMMNRGEVSDVADISTTSFNKHIEKLLDAGIVRVEKEVGNIRFYTLNRSNDLAENLLGVVNQLDTDE